MKVNLLWEFEKRRWEKSISLTKRDYVKIPCCYQWGIYFGGSIHSRCTQQGYLWFASIIMIFSVKLVEQDVLSDILHITIMNKYVKY